MTHLAIITGLSGCERYLARGFEVTEKKKARRFRSPGAADAAAKAHIKAFPAGVARQMAYQVVPDARESA